MENRWTAATVLIQVLQNMVYCSSSPYSMQKGHNDASTPAIAAQHYPIDPTLLPTWTPALGSTPLNSPSYSNSILTPSTIISPSSLLPSHPARMMTPPLLNLIEPHGVNSSQINHNNAIGAMNAQSSTISLSIPSIIAHLVFITVLLLVIMWIIRYIQQWRYRKAARSRRDASSNMDEFGTFCYDTEPIGGVRTNSSSMYTPHVGISVNEQSSLLH